MDNDKDLTQLTVNGSQRNFIHNSVRAILIDMAMTGEILLSSQGTARYATIANALGPDALVGIDDALGLHHMTCPGKEREAMDALFESSIKPAVEAALRWRAEHVDRGKDSVDALLDQLFGKDNVIYLDQMTPKQRAHYRNLTDPPKGGGSDGPAA